MRLNPRFACLFVALLAIEIAIALFVRDTFVRPFLGDLLVGILIYTLIRSFLPRPSPGLALGVLAFAVLIEIGQFFELAARLGLEHNLAARIIIGSTFDWLDILAYALGTAVILRFDRLPTGPTQGAGPGVPNA